MPRNTFFRWAASGLILLALLVLSGCSTCMSMSFLGVKVKAVDENNMPLAGATVYASNGDMQTTGPDGMVSVRFGGMVGSYVINVEAPDRMPSTLSVSMPLDAGKELTARLPKLSAAPAAPSVNIGASFGMMAGLGNMILAQLYPMMFQYLFTANGYSLDFVPYQPGQWTEWKIYTTSGSDEDGQMLMRKAFLKRLDNKQEWWQVRLKGEDGEKDMLFEVLFSADRQSIRRMRNLGQDGKPAEVPVSEGWYAAPQKLTEESLEGSLTQREVSVKVPAGSYKADLFEFSNYGNGKVQMWRVNSVPGAIVKSRVASPDDSESWHSELTGFGNDAKTELNSY